MKNYKKSQRLKKKHAVGHLLRGVKYKNPQKIRNTIRMRQEFSRRNTRIRSFPVSIAVEPTNVCNLRCPFCHTGSGISKRPKGFMSLEDFCTIVDKTGRYLTNIVLHNQGESTLNKHIFDMIRYAREHRIRTFMSSNLTQFDDEVCEKIIDSGLDTLVVSIDGVSEETYQSYRIGSSYKKVYGNLERLVALKKKKKKTTPHILWSFLIFKYNTHEVEEAARQALKLGTEFCAQSAGLGGTVNSWETDEELKKEWLADEDWVPRYYDYLENQTAVCRGPCIWLWRGFVVFWNGIVSPCCYVDDPQYTFGNILQQDLEELWNNRYFRAGRDEFHVNPDDHTQMSVICRRCTMFEKPARKKDK